jgi:hypothetical protein
LGFYSYGDIFNLVGNMLSVIFGRDPFARNLMKMSWSNPGEFYDFFGYGLFVDWKRWEHYMVTVFNPKVKNW